MDVWIHLYNTYCINWSSCPIDFWYLQLLNSNLINVSKNKLCEQQCSIIIIAIWTTTIITQTRPKHAVADPVVTWIISQWINIFSEPVKQWNAALVCDRWLTLHVNHRSGRMIIINRKLQHVWQFYCRNGELRSGGQNGVTCNPRLLCISLAFLDVT